MQRHWSAVFITLLFISTSQSALAQSLEPAYLTFGGGLILLLILTFYVGSVDISSIEFTR